MEQGGVFRRKCNQSMMTSSSLNPFRTGQGLSTGFNDKKDCFEVLIPLEQGGVFRQNMENLNQNETTVSIPLEQGGVFRHFYPRVLVFCRMGLNPFRTGRGLSTQNPIERLWCFIRLNPFRTGRGLSTNGTDAAYEVYGCLNPFRTGRGLSTKPKNK